LEKKGASLLKMHGNSPSRLIQSLFPEHKWLNSHFTTKLPSGFWHKKQNQRDFLDKLEIDLGLKGKHDWINVTKKHFLEKGGGTLLKKYGNSPSKVVQSVLFE